MSQFYIFARNLLLALVRFLLEEELSHAKTFEKLAFHWSWRLNIYRLQRNEIRTQNYVWKVFQNVSWKALQ